jgi:hypothetical protein
MQKRKKEFFFKKRWKKIITLMVAQVKIFDLDLMSKGLEVKFGEII